MTTLVIHPGALGDVLLAVPALRALRADGGSITLAAQPRIGALLVALGVVDHAIAFDSLGLEALFTDAPLAPDALLARHVSAAARVVCWFGARDATFTRRLRALAPGASIAAPAPPPDAATRVDRTTMRVWEHLLATVCGRGSDRSVRLPQETVTPVTVAPSDMEAGRAALRAKGWDGAARVVIVHPGAGGAAKRWPADGFAGVVAPIDATLVVHEGPADADAVGAFAKHTRRSFIHLANPALPTLAGALSLASAYVGNDSGVSHLAAAVGSRSVVLFTPQALAWVPWSPAAHCLTVTTSSVDARECIAVAAAVAAAL